MGDFATGWDQYYVSPCYLDGRAFKEYADAVRSVIFAADAAHKALHADAEDPPEFSGISIRYIHAALGDRAKREWTADALEAIRDIEERGVRPTLYAPLTRPIAGIHKPHNEKWSIPKPKPKTPTLGLN